MRPDSSRRASFNRPSQAGLAAYKRRIERLLRLVGLCLRRRAQRCYRVSLENIEAGHRLRERQDTKQRTARQARWNPTATTTRAEAEARSLRIHRSDTV